ncbi:AAA family ATPase [Paenibacillus sp. MMO-177]|uniref:AAA family ATPase n=1 Tax=Paenibacillus sp. MMO-177 TaxID=3081289 RepID=UPI00301A4A64
MKILVALSNLQLAEEIGEIIPTTIDCAFAYNELEYSKTIGKIGHSLDYLIIHEEIFSERYPWEWLSMIRSSVPMSTKIIVFTGSQTDSLYREIMNRVCLDLNIVLVQGALSRRDITNEIMIRVFGQSETSLKTESGRLVTFMSAATKDGSTTIAISSAICMAQRLPEKRILLLDLNLKSPEIRDHLNITSNKGYNLIQADCDAGTLEQGILEKACDQIKGINNLFILTGLQRREWAEKISVEEIEHLLFVARKHFDYVIADVHTYPDQAATVKCIKEANERIVVVQSVITSYQSSWNDWYNSVWQHYGLTETQFSLVLNRDTKTTMEGFQIEKSIGTKIITRIHNVDKGAGIKAINYGQPLYLNESVDAADFQADILTLCNWLAKKSNFELSALESDRKSSLHSNGRFNIRRFLRM